MDVCEESTLQVIKNKLKREQGQESEEENEFEELKFEEEKKEDVFEESEVLKDACENFEWVSASQINVDVKKVKKRKDKKRQRKNCN